MSYNKEEECHCTTSSTVNDNTILTETINYLSKQYRYIEETVEDEQLRGNSVRYLATASSSIRRAIKCLNMADLALRKQRGISPKNSY